MLTLALALALTQTPTHSGCNVVKRVDAVGAACLAAPSGVVISGERLEESL